jgi:hypothetical protein
VGQPTQFSTGVRLWHSRGKMNLKRHVVRTKGRLLPIARVRLRRMPPMRAKCFIKFVGPATAGVWCLLVRQSAVARTVELSSLLLRHVRQQTEVVLLNRFLPTSVSKLALDRVPVQNEIRRRMAGKQCGDLPGHRPHFAG